MKRSEKGFTLIEMLTVVAITGLIMAAVTQAMIAGLRTMDNTNARIAGSNDTQLIAGYFTTDVASSEFVSVIGSTFHSAPATAASSANSQLLSLFTLARGTTTIAPDGMTEQWDLTSTGASPLTQVTVAMDDQPVAQGTVSDRVLESADGTYSIDHSLVLAPALGNAIAYRSKSMGSTAGATSLTLARPDLVQTGDMLVAQVGVAGGTTSTVSVPSGWTLVESRDAGKVMKSLVYTHTATPIDPVSWTWTLNGSRESAGGVVAYSGVGSVSAHITDVSPCGGNPPLLLLRWNDAGTSIAHEVTYNFVQNGTEYTLVRKHCTNNTGVVVDQQTLARNLSASPGATAACQPTACGPLSGNRVIVTLTMAEPPAQHETVGRVYEVRGSTRTTA